MDSSSASPKKAPETEKSSTEKLLRTSDVISILVIGEAFAWLLMVIKKNAAIPVPQQVMWALPVVLPIAALALLWGSAALGRKRPFLFQLGKYAAVGFFNSAIDFGVFNTLILLTHIDPKGMKAGFLSAGGFIVAVVNSYLWNKYWTFRSKGPAKTGEFLQFTIVSLIGLILNFVYVSAMTKFIAPPFELNITQWANVVKVTGVVISVLWNFIGYKFIVFREEKRVTRNE